MNLWMNWYGGCVLEAILILGPAMQFQARAMSSLGLPLEERKKRRKKERKKAGVILINDEGGKDEETTKTRIPKPRQKTET
jgi:hypothetical protein